MALGQRFKVLVLVPLIVLTAVFAVATCVAHGGGAWPIGKIAAVTIVGLQIGYLLGLGVLGTSLWWPAPAGSARLPCLVPIGRSALLIRGWVVRGLGPPQATRPHGSQVRRHPLDCWAA